MDLAIVVEGIWRRQRRSFFGRVPRVHHFENLVGIILLSDRLADAITGFTNLIDLTERRTVLRIKRKSLLQFHLSLIELACFKQHAGVGDVRGRTDFVCASRPGIADGFRCRDDACEFRERLVVGGFRDDG